MNKKIFLAKCGSYNFEEDRRRSGVLARISKSKFELKSEAPIEKYPKTTEEEQLIKKAILKNEFLANLLYGKRLQTVIDYMYQQTTKEGQIIIEEGDLGNQLYISQEGKFEVTMKNTVIRTFNDVRVFGELSILYKAKRQATIKSLTKGVIWILECNNFKSVMIRTAMEEQEEVLNFLKNMKTFHVPTDRLLQVATLFKSEYYKDCKEIVREGERGDKFFIIRAGCVTVTKKGFGKVTQLTKGDYFGELALLKESSRQATVIADPPGVECLTLTRKQFCDHFGDIKEFTNTEKYTDSLKKAKLKSNQNKINNDFDSTNFIFKDFRILKLIGKGGYGKVELIQNRENKNLLFALKSIKKHEITETKGQTQIFNEKDLQMSCKSSFVVELYKTFRDSKYLYFLMEYCPGGDLWTLMNKQKKHYFDEISSRFYAGCVVEALNYLHANNIIYRDLKLENLLIDKNGYIKLSDFGFAKRLLENEKSYTFVGTSVYMAPEIILNKGHNRAVDYWSLGILIFEMLCGGTPFYTGTKDHLKTYKLILKGIERVQFPIIISTKAKHLIRKLCKFTPSDRLGCLKGGIMDIKNHPWFTSLNWEKLQMKKITAPFRPTLRSPTDTKYFDEVKLDNSEAKDDFSNWDEHF